MSEDEKAQYVGEATIEFQAAKLECAHIEMKIEKVLRHIDMLGKQRTRSRTIPYMSRHW